MTKGVYIVEVKNKAMNRNQKREFERKNLRSMKGETVRLNKKSERLQEFKKKTAKRSFINSALIGLGLALIYLYFSR
jgi:hypothetical protein